MPLKLSSCTTANFYSCPPTQLAAFKTASLYSCHHVQLPASTVTILYNSFLPAQLHAYFILSYTTVMPYSCLPLQVPSCIAACLTISYQISLQVCTAASLSYHVLPNASLSYHALPICQPILPCSTQLPAYSTMSYPAASLLLFLTC